MVGNAHIPVQRSGALLLLELKGCYSPSVLCQGCKVPDGSFLGF